jgi:short subunit dehydrogenase-like uncharacterized protein
MTNLPQDTPRWLLYGANGYTGELIAREAVKRGQRPILAGRSAKRIAALARELQCEYRVFSLQNQTATLVALQDVGLVLNCAGPFAHTAGVLMQACLASHVHYLDIAGEISVFELAHSLHEKAQRAQMVLCPGVGFDVVPTDCVAARLRAELPAATSLALAFASRSRASVGTAKTSIESLRSGGQVRRDGKIVSVPLGHSTRTIDLGQGPLPAVCIPWGDVSTAYYTTGIPNIEVYRAGSAQAAVQLQKAQRWRWLLGNGFVQWLMKRAASRGERGPGAAERDNNATLVWGEATDETGQKRVVRMRVANGYALTVTASLAVVERLLAQTAAGFYTPSQLMGMGFAEALPGSSVMRVDMA